MGLICLNRAPHSVLFPYKQPTKIVRHIRSRYNSLFPFFVEGRNLVIKVGQLLFPLFYLKKNYFQKSKNIIKVLIGTITLPPQSELLLKSKKFVINLKIEPRYRTHHQNNFCWSLKMLLLMNNKIEYLFIKILKSFAIGNFCRNYVSQLP